MRICIVTWAHVSNNPRVVKEADALVEAGHDVRVVAHESEREFTERDEDVVRRRRWRLVRLGVAARHGRASWLAHRAVQRAARALFDGGLRSGAVRDLALNPYTARLASVAAAEPAELVIGHNLRALPAAARAAAALGAKLGFDFEDLHFAEMPDGGAFSRERELVTQVEAAYVPRCDLLTASSSGIAAEVARAYGVRRPRVVLNAFSPDSGSDSRHESAMESTARVSSLYWYSQVIGPDRGLEEAIAAVGSVGVPVSLHLRGRVDADYRDRLADLARRAGIADALHFLPPAPADDLVALASRHDVGLALEQPSTLNRDLCVTNKILTYLAAGIAVAATATRGQREVMDEAPGAGFTYEPGNVPALVAGIRRLLTTPGALDAAKDAAAAAAARRFNWERESRQLVDYLTGRSDGDASESARFAREAVG